MSIRTRMKKAARAVDRAADITVFAKARHIYSYGATPHAVLTHALGSLCLDTATEDVYIKSDVKGGTAWTRFVV